MKILIAQSPSAVAHAVTASLALLSCAVPAGAGTTAASKLDGICFVHAPMASPQWSFERVEHDALTGEMAILIPHARVALNFGLREVTDIVGNPVALSQFSAELSASMLAYDGRIEPVLAVMVTHVFHAEGTGTPTTVHTATILGPSHDLRTAAELVRAIESWIEVPAREAHADSPDMNLSLGAEDAPSVTDDGGPVVVEECIASCRFLHQSTLDSCTLWFRLQLHRILASPYDPAEAPVEASRRLPVATAQVAPGLCAPPPPWLNLAIAFAERVGPSMAQVIGASPACRAEALDWYCDCSSIACGVSCGNSND